MTKSESPNSADDLTQDPLLRPAPVVEGFKVLEPAVLYARVGKGGMGAVYRGRHYNLDLDVAVKCLKPSLVDEDEDFVKRFEREARLAASIAHQNVVRVMDVLEKNGLHYLVMEFVRGETAAERVARKGKLAESEALAILLGATAGLAEAHQRGIVHRDIKPENILVSLEGRVKLADLGLAKATSGLDGRSISMPVSRIMGTPQYMPPEQWDTTDVTAAADIWALGATFYFLCTGHAGISGAGAFHAVARRIQEHDYPTLRAERPDLRPETHAMFERCVRRDPKDRFADARVLLRELKRLAIDDEDVLVDPETGTGIARAGMVTPPPRQTMLRIRAQVETLAAGKQAAAEPAGGSTRSEAPTIPSVDRPSGASSASPASPASAARIETGIGLTMIRIEPKPFLMGSPEGEAGRDGHETLHRVTISKPYWIGETAVTQGQWKAVMGPKSWGGDNERVGDLYPATSVSWTDAVAFCAELTKQERAGGRLPSGYEYSLPSEAEWEYACRGGSTTAFCFGDDERRLADYAVFGKDYKKGNSAEPVRKKRANAFGLYDMHGNVWEWCADAYEGELFDAVDPLHSGGSLRVFRGGSWINRPPICRSAYRIANDPSVATDFVGFRPALVAMRAAK